MTRSTIPIAGALFLGAANDHVKISNSITVDHVAIHGGSGQNTGFVFKSELDANLLYSGGGIRRTNSVKRRLEYRCSYLNGGAGKDRLLAKSTIVGVFQMLGGHLK